MRMVKRTVCTILVAMMILVTTAGCSSNKNSMAGSPPSSGQKNSSETSSGISDETAILGKVTSIVGNEVILALGTQPASTTASSSELTLTEKTTTLLIPVGLKLSTSGGTASAPSIKSESDVSVGGTSKGTSTTEKSPSAKTSSAGKTSTSSVASGFSSISSGNILQVTQKTLNGVLTVVKVAVVSK